MASVEEQERPYASSFTVLVMCGASSRDPICSIDPNFQALLADHPEIKVRWIRCAPRLNRTHYHSVSLHALFERLSVIRVRWWG